MDSTQPTASAHEPATLEQLFCAGLAGDRAAYQQFLTQVSHGLRRFIGRRVPAADVEDVLQEVLVSIHKARHTYDGQRAVMPWVSSIARYRLADYLRRYYADMRQSRVDIDDVEFSLAEPVTESSELYEYVETEVKLLPPRQQRILHLMHTQGYTAREVGGQLGMSETAVKVAAHRAYQKIKHRIKGT